MKRIKAFLEHSYQKRVLDVSKDCPDPEMLCDYTNRALPLREKDKIESHLAECYHCLDTIVSISAPTIRRWKLKKEYLYLIMAVICFISSFIFSGYFLQFLAATIILGIKWIVDSKNTKMLIMINEAWKRGGEREAGRILEDMKIKNERRWK